MNGWVLFVVVMKRPNYTLGSNKNNGIAVSQSCNCKESVGRVIESAVGITANGPTVDMMTMKIRIDSNL